jgi:hypothetical protein
VGLTHDITPLIGIIIRGISIIWCRLLIRYTRETGAGARLGGKNRVIKNLIVYRTINSSTSQTGFIKHDGIYNRYGPLRHVVWLY